MVSCHIGECRIAAIAPDCKSGGFGLRWSESNHSHHYASVAHPVERRSEKPGAASLSRQPVSSRTVLVAYLRSAILAGGISILPLRLTVGHLLLTQMMGVRFSQRKYASVAHLVERRFEEPGVASSTLAGGTSILPFRLKVGHRSLKPRMEVRFFQRK